MKRPRTQLFVLNDPYPMRISGALAEEIGLNESIFLLQIEYLISVGPHERDGKLWTYQTLSDLKERYFRWWSISTISRTAEKLQAAGLIHIGNYNKKGYDRTQWYALNEEGINKLASVVILQNEKSNSHHDTSILQNEKSMLQDDTTIPETTTETTSEIQQGAAATPTAAPAGKKVKRPALLDELPAVAQDALKHYRDTFGRWPNEDQMREIAARVTDLEQWKAVCHDWNMNGWNQTAIGKMLARYDKPAQTQAVGSPAERVKISWAQLQWMLQQPSLDDLRTRIQQNGSIATAGQYQQLVQAGMPC